jgi:hypothetical protein
VLLPVVDAGGTRATLGVIQLTARAPGPWANNLEAVATVRDAARKTFDLTLRSDDQDLEVHRGLSLDPSARERFVETALHSASARVTAKLSDGGVSSDKYLLQGGVDATAEQYKEAIDRLASEPDVDLVLAAVQDFQNLDKLADIYGAVVSHCNNMADACQGRIGIGQVAPGCKPREAQSALASKLISDRFMLLAPHGVAGATAGMLGNLTYFFSPTFKNVSGLSALNLRMDVEAQKDFLRGNVVPVVNDRSKGIIVLRGLTTDGDQVNVRRTADRAVRGVKMIGDQFIGRLNNADGRSALKEKLVEFFLQLQKDGAIVPSTDGKDPAFKVSVSSSQTDFALGIVRVEVAVRPVRAIDYIYATIQVQL